MQEVYCVAQYNKDSLLLLIAAFPNKIGSFLNKQDIHGNTVLHYAVAYNKDSLAALIESFPNEVERLLDVQNNYGITALQLAITYHAASLKVLMTERFVHKMLNIQNVRGDTVLHYAAVNTESLKILMNIFQEYGLQIINNDGSTVLHYAAALNKNSLAVLIEMFPNEVKSLLSKKDFHGHTVWHYTINNKDSLALLIASFPNEVESLFNEVYHSIAPNLRQLIDNLLIRFVSSNNVIDSDNNMDIYGAEVGIAIPGIPEALSYYYQDHVSFLLKLRLEDAKPGALKSIDVLEDNYTLRAGNEDDTSAKLSSFIIASKKDTILIPLNIGGKHLVGIAAKKYEGEVVLYYMDSELNTAPESFFAKISATLKSRGYSTEQVIVEVEKQHYSNCGPEVIENLTAFASGKKRTSQEEAVLKHSTLFEKHLLKDAGYSDSKEESKLKSMPVLSESATILGNMLSYERSMVSDMKKSIELNIANTDLLVDAKTQAQLIYYYKTGELLPSARSMLERNSAAIQEHYKFSIANETFEVSMPDTLLTDGKLEAQVLHYLRTGELFESARSALESGAVRVISQSSNTSEEEVENTVSLRGARMQSSDSYNDSGETLCFSTTLFTNDSTDGLLYSLLNPLFHLSENNGSVF
ncbi:ankyrin repeat domain-containing protein [Candidatus Lariskella endosymbiont of Epinotia ramella]|uniref:ankyrin repeat domain-containing protein n=1 Tax=Candidatus Lariskella endosymbiont of Epinotia ramella TaxID=3066224 RepID=UPI0030CF55E0